MITNGLNVSDSGLPSYTHTNIIPHVDGYKLTSGLFNEFRIKVDKYYENVNSWYGLRFTPNVASNIIVDLLNKEENIIFHRGKVVTSATVEDNKIQSIEVKNIDENGNLTSPIIIKGKFFIDATITGDLAEYSGVNMTIGREAPSEKNSGYNEGFAGELYWNPKKSRFLNYSPDVDSVKSDDKVQAYSYFLTVKEDSEILPDWKILLFWE